MNLRPDDGPIRPFAADDRHLLALGGGYDPARLDYEAKRDRADRRRLRWFVLAAAALHLLLLGVHLPDLGDHALEPATASKVFVVQPVRFQPPPPAAQREIPKPKTRKVPIPDPTPDDPEPIRIDEELPDVELPSPDVTFFGLPDAPPGPALPQGIMEVGGEVSAPVRLVDPPPTYTEEARAGRVQGVVILRLVIDREGAVRDVRVVKGLPMGLSERSVETVQGWRFEPARRNGEPVPVYYTLTVSFTLQ